MINKRLPVRVASLILLVLFPTVLKSAILTDCSEAALRTAIDAGGLIQLGCDGVIPISTIITISKPITIDANGHSVSLSGQNKTQLFAVTGQGELTLRGLRVVEGYSVMNGGAIMVTGGILNMYQCRFLTNGAYAEKTVVLGGFHSYGGAIYNLHGKVSATQCRFSYNSANGGEGGISAAGGDGLGGGIYSDGGSIALTNCDFISNFATGGAGGPAKSLPSPGNGGSGAGGSIYLKGAELTVVDSDFLGCIAYGGNGGVGDFSRGGGGFGRGGAIAINGNSSVLIRGANLNGNIGNGGNTGLGGLGGDAQGGALFCQGGQLVLRDCNLKSNEAFQGFGSPNGGRSSFGQGGALFNASTSIVTRCLIQDNKATGGTASILPSGPIGGHGEGGGVYNVGQLVVDQSALIHNTAIGGGGSLREVFGFPPVTASSGDGLGGGIFSTVGEFKLLNSTLANNLAIPGAAVDGGLSGIGNGGACFSEGNARIRFCTIARNESDGASLASSGTMELANSIVAYSTKGSNMVGKIVDLGQNISSDASVDLPGKGSRMSTDPLLLPLGNNGGPTPTMGLVPDSPALDAAVDANAPLTDQRGVERPALRALDIGAYELQLDGFRIDSFQFGVDRRILLSGSGPAQQAFTIESSSNLRDWGEIVTGRVDASGRWSVEVPNAGTTTFYRAK